MISQEDSFFNYTALEDKGFRQIYSDVLEKLDIMTDCKYIFIFYFKLVIDLAYREILYRQRFKKCRLSRVVGEEYYECENKKHL